ncbi:hypothetical protein G6F68_021328 [Rhizopus microsporus]|nr:hypothetical protein G6F68_021328 [Rhizopus microsporus]
MGRGAGPRHQGPALVDRKPGRKRQRAVRARSGRCSTVLLCAGSAGHRPAGQLARARNEPERQSAGTGHGRVGNRAGWL